MRNSGTASGSAGLVGGAATSGTMSIGGSSKKNSETVSFTSTPTQRTNSSTLNDHVSPFVLDYGGNEAQHECPVSANSSSAIKNKDLAFSIVWSPLPPITWLIPFVGHTGIADSQGVVSDFRGPYYVGDDGRMAFGAPTRALRVRSASNNSISPEQWDDAIQEANEEYRHRMHNICCDNCHSHVAYALHHMNLTAFGVQKHNMVTICFLIFFRGQFLSWGGFVKQFLPFALLLGLFFLVKRV